jgi:hypothetical protein
MKLTKIFILTTELTASIDFTDELIWLRYLASMEQCVIWCNGGNCKRITADSLDELLRVVELLQQVDDETEIKKGQPPQHRIYWDDCPALPSDLSQLLHQNTDDQCEDASVDN